MSDVNIKGWRGRIDGSGNTNPTPPIVVGDDILNKVTASHPDYPISQLEYSIAGVGWYQYTAPITLTDDDYIAGYILIRVKAAILRNPSQPTPSPAFTKAPPTIPLPPTVVGDDTADLLSASHPDYAITEILYRKVTSAIWLQYTGPISVGNVILNPGDYIFIIKSAAGRAESSPAYSPAFTMTNVDPPAPTSGVVDDSLNTFGFTLAVGYPLTEHVYAINGSSPQPVTQNPIFIGNISVGIGGIEVWVKAAAGRNASAHLTNAQAFTYLGNTDQPDPPTPIANDTTNYLSFSHILQDEIEVSENYAPPADYWGAYYVKDLYRPVGFWRARTKANGSRPASEWALSPEFTITYPLTLAATGTTRIQAESFSTKSTGLRVEDCADTGGGKQLGNINPLDKVTYLVHVPTTGYYRTTYRAASSIASGFKMKITGLVSGTITTTLFGELTMTPTGGNTKYTSQNAPIDFHITAGDYEVTLEFVTGGQNFNWFEWTSIASTPGAIELPTAMPNQYPSPQVEAVEDDVTFTSYDSNNWVLSNGNGGIRIPKASTFGGTLRAPIQAVINKDGYHSNLTSTVVALNGAGTVTGLSVTVLVGTVDEHQVEVRYRRDAGDMVYTYTLKRGYKCVMLLMTRVNGGPAYMQTPLNLSSGAYNIDRMRWRGYQATAVRYGYEELNGNIVYREYFYRGEMDATVDVDLVTTGTRDYNPLHWWGPGGQDTINQGWYYQFYNAAGASNTNMLGVFPGGASKLMAASNILVVLYTESVAGTIQPLLKIQFLGTGPAQAELGIYFSSKADVFRADKYQPIGIYYNYLGGIGAKIDRFLFKPGLPNDVFFQGAIYSSAAQFTAFRTRVKTDNAFYQKMVNVDGLNLKSGMDAWRQPATYVPVLIAGIRNAVELFRDTMRNMDGIRDWNFHYWLGATHMRFVYFDTMFILCDADSSALVSAEDRAMMLRGCVMLLRVGFDPDFVPPDFNKAGVSGGTDNMPIQWEEQGKKQPALMFSNLPEVATYAAGIYDTTVASIDKIVDGGGAVVDSTWYFQTTLDPTLFTMLQLRQAGYGDIFGLKIAKFTRLVDFLKSMLTPPSPRFGNYRVTLSVGDANEYYMPTWGMLAECAKLADPAMSSNLYAIFHNAASASQFGSVGMACDFINDYPYIPTSTVAVATSNFTGYVSNLRHAPNTLNESALWLIAGDWYKDHRPSDRGMVALYMLRCMLSVPGSSLYNPRQPNAAYKAMVLPETSFPTWNGNDQPIADAGQDYATSTHLEFVKMPLTSMAKSRQIKNALIWDRKTVMLSIDADKPVAIIFDVLNNGVANICSMPFMSKTVTSPLGAMVPVQQFWSRNDSSKQLADATVELTLPAGLNKFTMRGQDWSTNMHPNGGIDWHLLSVLPVGGSTTVSEWKTNYQYAWAGGVYQQTNNNVGYFEVQQYLRIKALGNHFNIILPFFKGNDVYTATPAYADGKVSFPYGSGTLVISENGYYYGDGTRKIVGSFGTTLFEHNGYSISGGVGEVLETGGVTKARVHGNSGVRSIITPSKTASINYSNTGSLNLLTTEQGYTEQTL